MSRHLLDTNIIRNVTKPAPSAALVAWMAEQADVDLFISSLTVAEIQRGLLEKPAGKKRKELERWFAGLEGRRGRTRVRGIELLAGFVGRRHTSKGAPASPGIFGVVYLPTSRRIPTLSVCRFWILSLVGAIRAVSGSNSLTAPSRGCVRQFSDAC